MLKCDTLNLKYNDTESLKIRLNFLFFLKLILFNLSYFVVQRIAYAELFACDILTVQAV